MCSCVPLQGREARVGNTEAETNHRGSALEQRRRLMEQKETELEGLQKELWKKVGGMPSTCLCSLPLPVARSSHLQTLLCHKRTAGICPGCIVCDWFFKLYLHSYKVL